MSVGFDAVVQALAQIVGQRVADAEITAVLVLIERVLVRQVTVDLEQVEAGRQIAIEEIRLGVADVEILLQAGYGRRERDVLAFAQQVAFLDTEIDERSIGGGVARPDRDFARSTARSG